MLTQGTRGDKDLGKAVEKNDRRKIKNVDGKVGRVGEREERGKTE